MQEQDCRSRAAQARQLALRVNSARDRAALQAIARALLDQASEIEAAQRRDQKTVSTRSKET